MSQDQESKKRRKIGSLAFGEVVNLRVWATEESPARIVQGEVFQGYSQKDGVLSAHFTNISVVNNGISWRAENGAMVSII